jgi:hypothetical protein
MCLCRVKEASVSCTGPDPYLVKNARQGAKAAFGRTSSDQGSEDVMTVTLNTWSTPLVYRPAASPATLQLERCMPHGSEMGQLSKALLSIEVRPVDPNQDTMTMSVWLG